MMKTQAAFILRARDSPASTTRWGEIKVTPSVPFCDAVAHALPWGVIGAFVAATIMPEKGVHLHSHGKRTGVGQVDQDLEHIDTGFIAPPA
jgi:hypothetical protein